MPVCNICGKHFRTARGLLQHMRRSHPEYLTDDPLERYIHETRKLIWGEKSKRRKKKRDPLSFFI